MKMSNREWPFLFNLSAVLAGLAVFIALIYALSWATGLPQNFNWQGVL